MFKSDYFKGWYFKCSSNDKTIAFICAYHRSNRQETASLQIITGDTVFNVPFNSLKYHEKPLYTAIGNTVFSENGIKLNIKNDKLAVNGELRFYRIYHILYDIMGPFRLIPFMQCRHSVYSMSHSADGQININGK